MDVIYAIPILIYFVIPIVGLVAYIMLVKRIKSELGSAPYIRLFFLFFIYGGLLITILTSAFWRWSILLSLSTLFLALPAPLITGAITFITHKEYEKSIYHKWIVTAAGGYILVLLPVFFLLHHGDNTLSKYIVNTQEFFDIFG